jgi:hypothetical protein
MNGICSVHRKTINTGKISVGTADGTRLLGKYDANLNPLKPNSARTAKAAQFFTWLELVKEIISL